MLDYFNVNICRNCCGFNHSYKKCYNDNIKKPCYTYCVGNHQGIKCENRQELKCANCCYANNRYNLNRDVNHAADNYAVCESYKDLLQRKISKTACPYNPIESD